MLKDLLDDGVKRPKREVLMREVPDWKMERLLLRELPGEELAELDNRVAEE